jgi:pSer/pThr/pTyr-binding forkhead associated (FHA) protein
MGRQLKIEIIEQEGTTPLGTLQSGEVRVGREPGHNGIAINRDGVSRVHGSFVKIQNHWLFRDNGSTNGSWVNGRRLGTNNWAIVRNGSIVQLADVGLRVLETADQGEQQSLRNFPALGGRCVLVFRDEEFHEEYPIPEYGRALTIGGSGGDLELRGDTQESPALVIERRADSVVCYSIGKQVPIRIDGELVDDTTPLEDGAQIQCGEYIILFNDPRGAVQRQAGGVDKGSVTGTYVRGWDEGAIDFSPGTLAAQGKVTGSAVFGTGAFDPESLSEIADQDESSLFDAGSSFVGRRTSAFNQPKSATPSYSSLEEKIILAIGLCVVFAVMVLLIWWLLQ